MQDLWTALEEHTRAWRALDRQAVADAIWCGYVSARFARTGDERALTFLYPYLNRGDRGTRTAAIEVAARIFEGRGPKAIDALDYFIRNTDSFVRDRAVVAVGAAVAGCADNVILDTLRPYLSHRNRFVQRLTVGVLSQAAAGSASERLLDEILAASARAQMPQDEVDVAVATLFAAAPTERAYTTLSRPDPAHAFHTRNDEAFGVLVKGATDEWFERACREIFEPRLHLEVAAPSWAQQFVRRAAVGGLSLAGAGRGMDVLRRMLHVRHNRCDTNALLKSAPGCFIGADLDLNKSALIELARTGDMQAQRSAATCLGRMMTATGDSDTLTVLTELCASPSGAVRASAIGGIGWAARYSCDDQLRELCCRLADVHETAKAAVRALGLIFQGSGRTDVFDVLRNQAERYSEQRQGGRRHSKPLAECYRAAGYLYQGSGSVEPVDFLLKALVPTPVQWCPYRAAAGWALVMIEFSERTLTRAFGDDWT